MELNREILEIRVKHFNVKLIYLLTFLFLTISYLQLFVILTTKLAIISF